MTEDSLNAASASASNIAARRALASYSLRRDRNSPFHGKQLVTPPPPSPVLTGTISTNSGAEGVKRKYPPHQSLVPPTLFIISCTNIIKTVVVVSNNNNRTKLFTIGIIISDYNYKNI